MLLYVGNCICIPLRRQSVQMEIVFQPRTAAQVCAASIVLCLLVLLPTEIWCIYLSGTRYDYCLHPQSRQNQKLLRQPPPRVMPLGVVGAWVGGWAGCWSSALRGLVRHRRAALAFAYVFPNQPSTIAWSSSAPGQELFLVLLLMHT